jgi:hypothetical protein
MWLIDDQCGGEAVGHARAGCGFQTAGVVIRLRMELEGGARWLRCQRRAAAAAVVATHVYATYGRSRGWAHHAADLAEERAHPTVGILSLCRLAEEVNCRDGDSAVKDPCAEGERARHVRLHDLHAGSTCGAEHLEGSVEPKHSAPAAQDRQRRKA